MPIKAIISGTEKEITRIPVLADGVYKDTWEVRDNQDRLIWYREDTLTGTSSISYRGYGIPLKSMKIVGNGQQNGTPSPDNIIMPTFCGVRTANLFDVSTATSSKYVRDADGTLRDYEFTSITDYIDVSGISTLYPQYFTDEIPIGQWAAFYDNAKTFVKGFIRYNREVTVPNNAAYVRLTIDNNYINNFTVSPTSLSNYEPYGYKLPITNAGQTTPVYLGQVQTVRRIRKLVLDGKELWQFFSDTIGSWQFYLNDINLRGVGISSCMSNIAPYGATATTRQRYDYGCYLVTSGNGVGFQMGGAKDTFTGIASWKSYLAQQYEAGTPVTVWYVLAEPEVAIVNEPLCKIGDYADELIIDPNITPQTGTNTLTVDTTLSPSSVSITGHIKPIRYGFKIDKQDVNPDTRVTYLYDAVGMTPAYMDFASGTFNYGSWDDVWFVKNNRPVALKFDGTVDYELNHTDFTKKLDGTASDVSDSTYAGNFMSEMPTVYVKRWEDDRYNYIVFSDVQYDSDYQAQAHTNENGVVNSAIYLPMFKGSVDSNNRMRSIMGTYPRGNTTGTNEITYASNCGTGWQIWDKAKIDLIMDLIVLITKSTNCRAKIGNGDCTTYNSSDTTNYGKMKSGYETDGTTRSVNAQFYGSEGTNASGYGKHHMSAFFIEDLWGNRWDRVLGFNLVNNVYKVKMTAPYSLNSDSSYETLSVLPPSSTEGWLKNISSGTYGDIPAEVGATNSTGFANYFYKNASGTRLSLFGGNCSNGLKVGRYWNLNNSSGNSNWNIGGSPCNRSVQSL